MPRKNTSATKNEADTSTTQATEESAVDLSAFESAVSESVAKRDESTGELALADIQPVRDAYQALDGLKAKNAAKTHLSDKMREAIDGLNISLARSYQQLMDVGAAPAKAQAKAKEPVNPTVAFVAQVAALKLALGDLASRVPEGVAEDWNAQADALYNEHAPSLAAYHAWVANEAEDKGDEPELSDVAKAALKVQSGRKAGTRKSGGSTGGPRGNIAKHITEAFADKASGDFMTVSEIANFVSSEYGESGPSAGAVAARLFPASGKVTVEGIVPGQQEGTGTKGARKA